MKTKNVDAICKTLQFVKPVYETGAVRYYVVRGQHRLGYVEKKVPRPGNEEDLVGWRWSTDDFMSGETYPTRSEATKALVTQLVEWLEHNSDMLYGK
jgi:hypothetical protein